MEEEKKKKRNKKKKNKQNNNNNHADENGRISQNGVVQDAAAVDSHHQLNASEGATVVDEVETDGLLPIEPNAQEKIRQLQEITDSYLLNQAALEEKIKQLQDENDLHLRKGATLEETVRLLKNQRDSYVEKEAKLQDAILCLQSENDALLQKETSLEDQIRQLLDERSAIALEKVSLEEKLRHVEQDRESWMAMENASKETIASLNTEISRLRVEVLEFEESKSCLLEQNHQLMANVSHLQIQLQKFERNVSPGPDELRKVASEQEELNSQIETACTLVEKLITENAELTEKVNELCIKLNQQGMSHRLSSATGNDSPPGSAETVKVSDPVSLSSENIPVVVQRSESLEDIPISDEVIHSDYKDVQPAAAVNPTSSEAESGEIVPVLFDANEDRDVESQAVERDNEDAVPLADAPLIGAPFRLVSFVARFITGADLVEKNSLNSRY